jgi:bifunctional aspartokinase / homoserine dehydrogenase 1
MSDKVIRLGGSQADNAKSIHHIVTYTSKSEGRIFIVLSAVPEILDIIYAAVDKAYTVDEEEVYKKLLSVYPEFTNNEPAVSYRELLDQLTGILKGIRLIGDYSEALKDQVLSFSEKLTAEVFQDIFGMVGSKANILWPEKIDLLVTPEYGNATFYSVSRTKLNELNPGLCLIPGSSDLVSYLIVKSSDKEKSVREIYKAFFIS